MKKSLVLAFLLIGSLAYLPAQAAETKSKVDLGAQPQAGSRTSLVQLTATVLDIDQANRLVTLEGPEGNTVTLKVSEKVQKLDKIKKGDKVNIQYQESLVWELVNVSKKAAKKKTVTTTTVTEAGNKPVGMESKEINLIATITSIDKEAPSVTLKGPEGKIVTFKVRDPEKLNAVKIGDQVSLTYTEALAVSVEKAKKK
jgi:Cu/Ag efflux protein CusF